MRDATSSVMCPTRAMMGSEFIYLSAMASSVASDYILTYVPSDSIRGWKLCSQISKAALWYFSANISVNFSTQNWQLRESKCKALPALWWLDIFCQVVITPTPRAPRLSQGLQWFAGVKASSGNRRLLCGQIITLCVCKGWWDVNVYIFAQQWIHCICTPYRAAASLCISGCRLWYRQSSASRDVTMTHEKLCTLDVLPHCIHASDKHPKFETLSYTVDRINQRLMEQPLDGKNTVSRVPGLVTVPDSEHFFYLASDFYLSNVQI